MKRNIILFFGLMMVLCLPMQAATTLTLPDSAVVMMMAPKPLPPSGGYLENVDNKMLRFVKYRPDGTVERAIVMQKTDLSFEVTQATGGYDPVGTLYYRGMAFLSFNKNSDVNILDLGADPLTVLNELHSKVFQ